MESVVDIQQTVAAASRGDQASFSVLYEHLGDRVFAFVLSRTSNRTVALDVTQDSFVELFKALPKFTYQSDAAFFAFVFTIVRRQVAQYYHRHNKEQVVELHEEFIAESGPGAAELHAVHAALATLDEATRDIVVLHHWSRYTFAEIAAMVNMTESAVRVRHHRARATLAEALSA